MVGQDLVGVVPVGLIDHVVELAAQVALLVQAGVAVGALDRHDHVHSVRLAPAMLVDPGQLDFELRG